MAESPYPVESVKEYDVREAVIAVGGNSIEDLESFGWDSSKGHEAQATIDNNRVWVKAVPEITGTVVMKATSPSIPAVRALYSEDAIFSITGTLSQATPAGQPGGDAMSSITFLGCMITSIDRSDHEVDGMPTITIDWQGVDSE